MSFPSCSGSKNRQHVNYNKVLPKYEPWELSQLNNQLRTWLGARGIRTIIREGKLVQVIEENSKIEVIPFDNYNRNQWWGPMTKAMGFYEDKSVILENCTPELLGRNIINAFNVATYNPNKRVFTDNKHCT